MYIQPLNLFNRIKPRFEPINTTQNVSFTALDIDKVEINETQKPKELTSLDFETAIKYSGTHCPCCGGKMLSKEDFIDIICSVHKIKSAKDLVKIIRNNQEYIPEIYRQILTDIDNTPNLEKITANKLVFELCKNAYNEKKQAVTDAKTYLRYIAENSPENKREKALEIVESIKDNENYSNYKRKINYFASYLNFSQTEYHMIRSDLLKNFLLKDMYFHMFLMKNNSNVPQTEISKMFLASLFRNSLATVQDISSYSNYKLNPNNRVITCTSCSNNQGKNVFWPNKDPDELKKFMAQYLKDIAQLIGEEKIEYNKYYLKNFCNAVQKLSRGKIAFSDEDAAFYHNIITMLARHEEFLPIKQTKVDVPCADCGNIMLPHDVRETIKKEMNTCQTPQDYVQILKKYHKYIGKYSRSITEIFIKLAESSPELTNEEFVEKYKQKVYKHCQNSVEEALQKFLDKRSYYVAINELEKVRLMDDIYENITDYYRSGEFSDFKYTNLYNECINRVNYGNRPFNIGIFELLKDLKTIDYKYLMAYKFEKLPNNPKDDLYAIIYSLFNMDLATADHLVAHSKGGSRDIYNLIGLCKGCNHMKGVKNVTIWFDHHKSVRYNLPKQLQVIDAMAYRKELPDYQDWAKHIAQLMFEFTDGYFDIREDFED